MQRRLFFPSPALALFSFPLPLPYSLLFFGSLKFFSLSNICVGEKLYVCVCMCVRVHRAYTYKRANDRTPQRRRRRLLREFCLFESENPRGEALVFIFTFARVSGERERERDFYERACVWGQERRIYSGIFSDLHEADLLNECQAPFVISRDGEIWNCYVLDRASKKMRYI